MKKLLTAFLAVAFIISIVAGLSATTDTVYTQSDDASVMNPEDGTTKMLSSGYGYHKMTTKESYDGFTWSNELRVNSVDAANVHKAYWGTSFSESGNDLIGYWFADKKFKIVVDGVTLVEKEYDWQMDENKWYDIMIRKFGDTVTLYCDNVEMVSASSDVFDGKWQLSFSNDGIDIDIGCIGIFMGEDFNIFDREEFKENKITKEKRKFKYYNFSDELLNDYYTGRPEKEKNYSTSYEDLAYLSRFEEDFTLANPNDYVVSDIGYLNFTWGDYCTHYHTGSRFGSVFAGYFFDSQKAGITYDQKHDLFSDSSAWPSAANQSFAWNEGETHRLAVRREGSTISVLIDGEVVVSYNNPGVFDTPITNLNGKLYFWSRYLSYTMDNLVLTNLENGRTLIDLDFSEDLIGEDGKDVNTLENINELFIDNKDFGNGSPGLLLKPTNPDADGVNRYWEYNSWATDRADYKRELYINKRRNPTLTDFEASMDVTIQKIANKTPVHEGELYGGTPAGIGFYIEGITAPNSAEGFQSNDGDQYNINDFTVSTDILLKSVIDMGFTDHEKWPEKGGRFYYCVGGTSSKGYNCYFVGYEAKEKKLFIRWSDGATEKDAIDPIDFVWPEDEWVNMTIRLHTVDDEDYGLYPEVVLYVNGEEKLSFRDEFLLYSGTEVGDEKISSLTFKKYDLQLALDNIVVCNGDADLSSDAFKVGCQHVGHVWDEGVVTLAATTKAEGAKLFTCKNCAQTRTEVLTKLSETPVDPDNPSNDPSNPNQGGSKKDDDKVNPGTSDMDVYAISSITVLLGGVAVAAKKKIFR